MEVGDCPGGVDDLLREQVLSSQTTAIDPWGRAFTIECDDAEPVVLSAESTASSAPRTTFRGGACSEAHREAAFTPPIARRPSAS